jgi:nucleoside 2-deoxyribosyltransferase
LARKPRIYIAGPISTGDQFANTSIAMRVWSSLYKAGFCPYCPHWSAIQHIHNPELSHREWVEYDFNWLSLCDAVLRMPGESKGADMEVQYAVTTAHIPVFYYGKERTLSDIVKLMRERLLGEYQTV